MRPYPHRHTAAAIATDHGDVALESGELPLLPSAPPAEFDGPGDRWSPETLLVAAIADCIVLTFRALARAARFRYLSISCEVEGKLDRVGRVAMFTEFRVRARLHPAPGASSAEARRLLDRAKAACLVTNSLKGTTTFEIDIEEDVESPEAQPIAG
jgi:organic hydroperoxide reductase OsmC/OhrA